MEEIQDAQGRRKEHPGLVTCRYYRPCQIQERLYLGAKGVREKFHERGSSSLMSLLLKIKGDGSY
jgi:hypothetical protein